MIGLDLLVRMTCLECPRGRVAVYRERKESLKAG